MSRSAVALIVAALAVASCGGQRSDAPAPQSPGAFAEAANRACSGAATRADRVARLRELQPPPGGAELYRRWLRAETDALAVEEAIADRSATFDQDPRIALAIDQGKITGYAQRLGAEQCSTSAQGRMPS